AAWLLAGLFALVTENRRARFMPLRYAILVYVGAQLAWYYFKAFPVLENPTMALLFWGCIGAILGLARRDRMSLAAEPQT
ncbi:MAG: hypothetical protein IT463_02640, partial [Planctomycetes bacterium]|nr:hypothetical protein [Planctomycetota bacterium]